MQDVPQPISRTDLQAALDASEARVAALEGEIAAKVAEMEEAKEESDLLGQLLRVRAGEDRAAEAGADAPETEPRSAPTHPVVREAIKELEEAGRPLHISELMDRLQGRGVRIPGRGKPANVIAHVSRDPHIVRTSRGIYGLAEWSLPAQAAPATRRRVRGRSKSEDAS
ncbi:MAG TPA: HTH domain-containing protein [Solirubrobacterales bacterium]|nr:HTH domain-containing protein [Solirubrobacterales bacterium]